MPPSKARAVATYRAPTALANRRRGEFLRSAFDKTGTVEKRGERPLACLLNDANNMTLTGKATPYFKWAKLPPKPLPNERCEHRSTEFPHANWSFGANESARHVRDNAMRLRSSVHGRSRAGFRCTVGGCLRASPCLEHKPGLDITKPMKHKTRVSRSRPKARATPQTTHCRSKRTPPASERTRAGTLWFSARVHSRQKEFPCCRGLSLT